MKKLLCFLLTLTLAFNFNSGFVYATPFDDDDAVIDLPSGPDLEPVDPYNQLSGIGDIDDDNNKTDENGQTTSTDNTSQSSTNNSLETAVVNTMSGEAAENVQGNFKNMESDTFDGKSTQFEGSDGSVTNVYEDGSVVTTNKDGTKQGVSGDGHPITIDKDGNETYHFEDGSVGVKYADGRKVQTYPDGSQLIQNADGSMSTREPAGYCTDLDEDGNVKSIYFENGERIDLFDENGNIKQGEQSITGPNGETVSFAYKEDENGNVTDFKITAEKDSKVIGVEARGDGEGNYDVSINAPDGSSFKGNFSGEQANEMDFSSGDGACESHYKRDGNKVSFDYKDENGEGSISEIKTENGTTTTVKNSDGSIATMITDEDGNVVSGEVKSKDGSYLKVNEDGTTEIIDKKTGLDIKLENGVIKSAHIPTKSGTYDFSDGTGVLVDKENDNKVMWTHDDDGNLVIVSPNGEYTVDENGNLFKDGKPVLFDGKQVNVKTGFNTGEEATEEATEEPDFIEQICGKYHLTGTSVTVGEGVVGSGEPEKEEYDITVSAGKGNNIKVSGTDGKGITMPIDPSTGVAYLDLNSIDEGFEYTLTFTVSEDKVHLDMKIFGDLTMGDEYYTDTTKVSGYKK